MKKLISAALVCIAACLMTACSSGQSPKATVEKYGDGQWLIDSNK